MFLKHDFLHDEMQYEEDVALQRIYTLLQNILFSTSIFSGCLEMSLMYSLENRYISMVQNQNEIHTRRCENTILRQRKKIFSCTEQKYSEDIVTTLAFHKYCSSSSYILIWKLHFCMKTLGFVLFSFLFEEKWHIETDILFHNDLL